MTIQVSREAFDAMPLLSAQGVDVAGTKWTLTVLERIETVNAHGEPMFSVRLGKVLKRK